MGFRLPSRAFATPVRNNFDENEADDLDQYITGGVDARKAIPVPVPNIDGYGRNNSGDQNETTRPRKLLIGVCVSRQITRIAWSTSVANSTASDFPNAN